MTSPNGNYRWTPRPEWVAAFLDGELDRLPISSKDKLAVRQWFALSPDAEAEIAAWHELRRLCEDTAPGPVDESTWSALWHRIQYRCNTVHEYEQAARASIWPWAVPIAAAAVVLLCLGLILFWRPNVRLAVDVDRSSHSEEAFAVVPFPVAQDHEVEVLSIEGQDTSTILVGRLPVEGPLEIARNGDVLITWMESSHGDTYVHVNDDPPMLWAPMGNEGLDER